MKQFKIALLTFAAFFTLTTATAAGLDSPSPTEELRGQVVSLLSNHYYSSLKSGEELEVKLTFMLNKKNEIVVIDVDSDDETIHDTIIDSLNYKKAKVEDAITSKPYYIDITILGRS